MTDIPELLSAREFLERQRHTADGRVHFYGPAPTARLEVQPDALQVGPRDLVVLRLPAGTAAQQAELMAVALRMNLACQARRMVAVVSVVGGSVETMPPRTPSTWRRLVRVLDAALQRLEARLRPRLSWRHPLPVTRLRLRSTSAEASSRIEVLLELAGEWRRIWEMDIPRLPRDVSCELEALHCLRAPVARPAGGPHGTPRP